MTNNLGKVDGINGFIINEEIKFSEPVEDLIRSRMSADNIEAILQTNRMDAPDVLKNNIRQIHVTDQLTHTLKLFPEIEKLLDNNVLISNEFQNEFEAFLSNEEVSSTGFSQFDLPKALMITLLILGYCEKNPTISPEVLNKLEQAKVYWLKIKETVKERDINVEIGGLIEDSELLKNVFEEKFVSEFTAYCLEQFNKHNGFQLSDKVIINGFPTTNDGHPLVNNLQAPGSKTLSELRRIFMNSLIQQKLNDSKNLKEGIYGAFFDDADNYVGLFKFKELDLTFVQKTFPDMNFSSRGINRFSNYIPYYPLLAYEIKQLPGKNNVYYLFFNEGTNSLNPGPIPNYFQAGCDFNKICNENLEDLKKQFIQNFGGIFANNSILLDPIDQSLKKLVKRLNLLNFSIDEDTPKLRDVITQFLSETVLSSGNKTHTTEGLKSDLCVRLVQIIEQSTTESKDISIDQIDELINHLDSARQIKQGIKSHPEKLKKTSLNKELGPVLAELNTETSDDEVKTDLNSQQIQISEQASIKDGTSIDLEKRAGTPNMDKKLPVLAELSTETSEVNNTPPKSTLYSLLTTISKVALEKLWGLVTGK